MELTIAIKFEFCKGTGEIPKGKPCSTRPLKKRWWNEDA